MIIDMHAHFTPPEWLEEIRRNGSDYGCVLNEDKSGRHLLQIGDQTPSPIFLPLLDLTRRTETMAACRLDRQVLATSMGAVGYHLGMRQAQKLSRLFNETVAQAAKNAGPRFIPVATVPMQSAAAAVEELDYAVKSLGIRMVEIGTNINGLNLDEERFRPFFARAAELEVLVQLHPHQECVAGVERLSRYFLSNLIGNPMDTAIAAASLIFGGVLEKYPSLKICLVHGGGALPFIIGRISHGHSTMEACRTIPIPPREYFRRFYFDTLVLDPTALRFLYEAAGAERLMLGTDYPYDNTGEKDPVGALERAGFTNYDQILGKTAAALLGISDPS
jgi:aminocarboxymuconate-semialdehyde decarboxylase